MLIDVISRVTHVTTAITLVGGCLFMGLVLLPSLKVLDDEQRDRLTDGIRGRWKRFVHGGIALFLISGFYNYYRAIPNHDGDGLYHALVGTKMLLALIVFFFASVLVGRSAKFEKWRQQPQFILRAMIVLSLLIVGISGFLKIRGIVEVVQAMGKLRSISRLNLVGSFSDECLKRQLQEQPGWQRVNPLGFLDRQGVRDVLSRSIAGLVTLHPVINYIDALPVKMFEYMSAGIPVIASDFPLWRDIIAGHDCGLLVDPLNPGAIAEAIDYLITNPVDAERMGGNGRRAIEKLYNWEHEGQKLLTFYDVILGPIVNFSPDHVS